MNLIEEERFSIGPSYLITEERVPTVKVVRIAQENMADFQLTGFEWLHSKIDCVQPRMAFVLDGQVVSVGCRVRITPIEHEAGFEILEEFHERVYAEASEAQKMDQGLADTENGSHNPNSAIPLNVIKISSEGTSTSSETNQNSNVKQNNAAKQPPAGPASATAAVDKE